MWVYPNSKNPSGNKKKKEEEIENVVFMFLKPFGGCATRSSKVGGCATGSPEMGGCATDSCGCALNSSWFGRCLTRLSELGGGVSDSSEFDRCATNSLWFSGCATMWMWKRIKRKNEMPPPGFAFGRGTWWSTVRMVGMTQIWCRECTIWARGRD